MCLSTKPPKPKPPPTPPDKAAISANAEDEARKRLAASKGTQQNIFTSPLGDPNFGKNSYAPTAIGTTFFANFGKATPSVSIQ